MAMISVGKDIHIDTDDMTNAQYSKFRQENLSSDYAKRMVERNYIYGCYSDKMYLSKENENLKREDWWWIK